MGTFRVDCVIENILRRQNAAKVPQLLVDTESDYTWVPGEVLSKIGIKREKKDIRIQIANGQTITRSVGFAVVRVGQDFTVDEVVFAEEGDMNLLGARSLEGMNLRVDSKQKKLVAAGPYLAAATQQ
jgi:predicted aspartyl protease